MIEFQAWAKTPRLFRDSIVTEKIDGTNAAIGIKFEDGDSGVTVYAQSRSRIITPEQDNFGFAAWVEENKLTLCYDLGPGLHFGEWWGRGIQRNYSMDERWFSLFNTEKWEERRQDPGFTTPNLDVVPVIARGIFDTGMIDAALADLQAKGSHAAIGFMRPEGVCVYHTAGRQVFKALIENDDKPKGVAA